MADIALAWNPATSQCDWSMGSGDLITGFDLQTAILLSLFTDAVATPDYQPPPNDIDRRGWWADAYAADSMGSNIWQLERGIKNDATLNAAITYAKQALQWMIDDGAASAVVVIGDWQGDGGEVLALQITVTAPDTSVSRFTYSWAWGAL